MSVEGLSLTYEDISAIMFIHDSESTADKPYARDMQQYKRTKDNHWKIAGRLYYNQEKAKQPWSS